jgi:hypothetical protein
MAKARNDKKKKKESRSDRAVAGESTSGSPRKMSSNGQKKKKSQSKRSKTKRKGGSSSDRAKVEIFRMPEATATTPQKTDPGSSIFYENNAGTRRNALVQPRVKHRNIVRYPCKSLNIAMESTLEFEINTGEYAVREKRPTFYI